MAQTRLDGASRWKDAKGVVALVVGAVILVGCLAALFLALSGDDEEHASGGLAGAPHSTGFESAV